MSENDVCALKKSEFLQGHFMYFEQRRNFMIECNPQGRPEVIRKVGQVFPHFYRLFFYTCRKSSEQKHRMLPNWEVHESITQRKYGNRMAQLGGENTHVPGALRPGPQMEGHSIQRDERQHAYVIDQVLIACTPAEYRILTLLLEQADRLVPFAQLWAQLQDEPLVDAAQIKQARTRIIHLMSDLRAKIWALGLDIVAVMNYGYILVSHPQEHGPVSGGRGGLSAERGEKQNNMQANT
jgi:hypothetical protein